MKEVSVFYKPTQMLSIGKGKLKRIHWEGMNILLKKAQDIIYYNTLVGTGAIKNNEYPIVRLVCIIFAPKTVLLISYAELFDIVTFYRKL